MTLGQTMLKTAMQGLSKIKKKVRKGLKSIASKGMDFLETSNYYQKDSKGNYIYKH
jgi:hypothetical protein